MANSDHLGKARQGADAWNAWRQEEPSLDPDLSGASLDGVNLSRANLSRTNLTAAKLKDANLAGANLGGAILRGAKLAGANLSAVTTSLGPVDLGGANLCGADLSAASLHAAQLGAANLSGAQLGGAILIAALLPKAKLEGADLSAANLSGADLVEADLGKANLIEANLSRARLNRANLREARLTWGDLSASQLAGSDLGNANMTGANLSGASLIAADLSGANLSRANLTRARLGRANLKAANLRATLLVETDLTNADLSGCSIYGISAWQPKLSGTKQHDLLITPEDGPEITTDDLEIAQFVSLVLHSARLHSFIDSISSKLVLVLGRFPPERRALLDALREQLRKPDLAYVPVVFDFEKAQSQGTARTVTMLARMARFVIAELSDAKGMLPDLQSIVASSPLLPVQPIIMAEQQEPGMFDFIERFPSVLKTHRYRDPAQLTADLDTLVVACRLKAWTLQLHSHDAMRPDIRQRETASGGSADA